MMRGPLSALVAVVLLAACASPPPAQNLSYVTLLPSPDGSVGKVVVRGSKGEQVLQQARQAALLEGSQTPGPVDEALFARDFGEALAARPALPEHFLLYFETGGAQLSSESLGRVQSILDSVGHRATVDVSVIGHSDTVGKADANAALSLKRALAVADLLKAKGIKTDALSVESHGERNLLVPTPDETPEPRNRRVEVTVR